MRSASCAPRNAPRKLGESVELKTPICDILGIEVPILLAGMAGVAHAEVCAAVSEAGGYGTLGMAGLSPDQIREQMREVRRRTDKPFGVDLLAALPEQMLAAIDVIIQEGASAFIAGLGVPGPVIQKCHDGGLLVMSMCGRVKHAVAAEQAGCDVVVAQGSEAGGHTGKVAGLALIPQVVDAVKIPVVAAGSIVDGRGLAAVLALGAQAAWMGTRFTASREAHAAEAFKKRITEIAEDQTIVTRCYSGKTMRVIRNSYVEEWERRPEEIKPFPQQAAVSAQNQVFHIMQADLVQDVDPDRDCIPCGQGAGAIRAILPCAEIIERVMQEARETIQGLTRLV
jgi:enoyl-[acyl-carrier protein] reductase II